MTLLFCSSANIYSVRRKRRLMDFLRQFISTVHRTSTQFLFYFPRLLVILASKAKLRDISLSQERSLWCMKTNLLAEILCIHFQLTFFALLDQRPRSDSLDSRVLMPHPINAVFSKILSRVASFSVSAERLHFKAVVFCPIGQFSLN